MALPGTSVYSVTACVPKARQNLEFESPEVLWWSRPFLVVIQPKLQTAPRPQRGAQLDSWV